MVRRSWAVAVGAAIGAMLAQGDLFLSGKGRSLPALLLIGGATGLLAFNCVVDDAPRTQEYTARSRVADGRRRNSARSAGRRTGGRRD